MNPVVAVRPRRFFRGLKTEQTWMVHASLTNFCWMAEANVGTVAKCSRDIDACNLILVFVLGL